MPYSESSTSFLLGTNLKIKTKLLLLVLFVGFFGACISVIGLLTNQGTIQVYHELTEEAAPKQLLLSRISDNANRLQLEALSYTLLVLVQDAETANEEDEDEEAEELEEME